LREWCCLPVPHKDTLFEDDSAIDGADPNNPDHATLLDGNTQSRSEEEEINRRCSNCLACCRRSAARAPLTVNRGSLVSDDDEEQRHTDVELTR